MDEARKWTDEQLKEMEKTIAGIYKESTDDLTRKWNEYMTRSNERIANLEKDYKSAQKGGDKDEINKASKELQDAKKNQTLRNDYYKNMVDETTTQLAHVNQTAVAYLNGQMPSVYLRNHNYLDKDSKELLADANIKFNMVDESVVKRRILDGDIKLPKKKVDIPKDKRWNTKQLNSSVLQGIIQGESMQDISKRILPVVDNNKKAAIRNARTMVTGAENQGRIDRYKSLESDGVVMNKVWLATGDGRTRDWHIDMDGQEVPVEEAFIDGLGNELEYPGDPGGAPETVYNCRCSMISHIVGFRRADGSISYVDYDVDETMHEGEIRRERQIRYEKRAQEMPKEAPKTQTHIVAEGKDISATWERRPDQFTFEIEDVINAQGFDGLPRVVDAEEFDRYVQDSNFIAQRGYTAPDEETLKAYQQQLYDGKWYVDCSTGGHMYGRGMYADGTFGTKVNETMEATMQSYGAGPNGKIETFTLASDAKILDYKDVDRLRQEYGRDVINKIVELKTESEGEKLFVYSQMGMTNTEESIKAMNWASENSSKIQDIYTKYITPYTREIAEIRNAAFSMDEGVLATLKGYDAINCENIVQGDADGYFVILNRTKCIFKGE